MKTIYKYPLLIEDKQVVSMPINAEILTVQIQNGIPCIWALVDTSSPLSDVSVRVYPTGGEVEQSQNLKYCGTFQMIGGGLVFHVFIDQ